MFEESTAKKSRATTIWNVVDPDDPYDIRKSMIARLPEHQQNFMGGNLEVVCLMQAAEIERLNIYLSEFKLKYKELERRELDRHYYEVLIKELTEKANESGQYKIDNDKLRQYIKRQSEQLQLKQRAYVDKSLQVEHQQLKKKYQSVLTELQSCRENLQSNATTINKLTQENKELRVRNDKLEKQRLTELTQEREKCEQKVKQKVEQAIKQVEHRLGSKIYQLESDCKLFRAQIESKNDDITQLILRNEELQKELENVQSAAKWEDRAKQLQTTNKKLSQQVAELQKIIEHHAQLEMQLKDVKRAFEKSQKQNAIYKSEIERLRQLADRGENDVKIIEEQQNKIALLSSELERLTFMFDNKNQQFTEVNNKLNALKQSYEKEIKQLKNQYETKLLRLERNKTDLENLESEIRRLKAMNDDLKWKNESLTKQLSLNAVNAKRQSQLEEELGRARVALGLKSDQIYNLQTKIRSNQNAAGEVVAMRKSLIEKQRLIDKINAELLNDEAKIINLSKDAQTKEALRKELENQVLKLKNQVEKYRLTLVENDEYMQRLIREVNESRKMVQQYEADINNGILVNYETYEKTSNSLMQQCEMLRQQIAKLHQELILKQRLVQSASNSEMKFLSKIDELTNSLKNLREDNDRLLADKNRFKQALSDAQKQAIAKQKQHFESSKQANRKIDELVATNQETRKENSRLRQQMSISHDNVAKIQKQNEQRSQNALIAQLREKDNIISSLERQNNAAREDLKALQSTYDNSHVTMKTYREKLLAASEQIEKLNEILMMRNKEAETMKSQFDNIDNLRKQLRERDATIENLKNQIRECDEMIRNLKNQKQNQQASTRQRLAEERENVGKQIRAEYELKMQVIQENKTKKLANENDSLNRLNEQLRNEIIGLKNQLFNKNAEMKQLEGQEMELKREKENLLKNIFQLEGNISQMQNNVRTNNDSLEKKCYEQQVAIKNLTQIIQQLQDINNHTTAERDHLFKVSHQYNEEVERLRQRLSELERKQLALNELAAKNNEISALYQKCQQQMRLYEAKIREAMGENERLILMLKEREGNNGVIAELKNNIHNLSIELDNKREEARSWQQKCIQIYEAYKLQEEKIRRIDDLEEQFEKLNYLVHALKEQNQDLRNMNQALKQENQQLGNRFSQINDSIEKNKFLSAQIDRLNGIVQQLNIDLSQKRLKFVDQVALQKRIEEHLALFVVLFAEIQTLRKRVSQTQKQCEDVRRNSLSPHRIDMRGGKQI